MSGPQIIDCVQGTKEWFQYRLGIPTASNFGEMLRNGKGGKPSQSMKTYMYKLAAEKYTLDLPENYSNKYMDRGTELEPKARLAYYFATGVEPKQVGIILNHGAGYSPDGLIDDDGSIEIKVRMPHIQLNTLIEQEVPRENVAQLQGGLWVSERGWIDYVSYCPKMPLFIKRVYRDEEMIERIADAVRKINYEVDKLVDQLKAMEQ